MRFRLASFARWLGPSFDLSSPSRYTRRRPSGRLRCLGPKAIRVYQPSVRDERPRRVTFRTYKGETSPGSVAIRGEEKSGSPLWRQGHNPCAAAPRDRALRFGLGDRRSRSGPPDGPAMDEGLAVRPTPSIASRSRLPRSSPQRRRSSSRNDRSSADGSSQSPAWSAARLQGPSAKGFDLDTRASSGAETVREQLARASRVEVTGVGPRRIRRRTRARKGGPDESTGEPRPPRRRWRKRGPVCDSCRSREEHEDAVEIESRYRRKCLSALRRQYG